MPLVVRLRSAVCLLGRFPALAGVDLDVATGEVLLVSGANGAGKSTLLRMLAGLLVMQSGQGEVLGHDLRVDRRSARRNLALVGHQTFCYDDLTVRENLRFAARAAGRSVEISERAMEQMDLASIATVAHQRLSAGQRRRLALAMALAREPRLLMLDEPHAGLDIGGRAAIDEAIAASPAQGRTVLLVSHELDRARALADREVVIAGGLALGGLLDEAPVPSGQANRAST